MKYIPVFYLYEMDFTVSISGKMKEYTKMNFMPLMTFIHQQQSINQFQMNKLLQLQEIILERIQDILFLKQCPQYSLQPSPMKSISPLIKANLTQKLQIYRKRQSIRLRKQLLLNQQQDHLQYDIKYISRVSINLMKKYDQQFDYVHIQTLNEVKIERQLRQILTIFLEKHAGSKQEHLIKIIKREERMKNNFNYVIWLLNWSRNMFFQSINNQGKGSKRKIGNSKFQKKVLGKQLTRKVKTQPIEQTIKQMSTLFFSKEHLYSYLKNQMQIYYEIIGKSMDLNEEYLKKFTNTNKKDIPNSLINDMTMYLVEKNGVVSKSINDYTEFYKKHKPIQQNNQMNAYMNILSATQPIGQKHQSSSKQAERISVFNFIKQNKVKKQEKQLPQFRSSISHSEESYRQSQRLQSRHIERSNYTRIYSPITKQERLSSRLVAIASKLQEKCLMHKKDCPKETRTQGKEFILSSFKLDSSYIKQQTKNHSRQNWFINKRFERNFTNLS